MPEFRFAPLVSWPGPVTPSSKRKRAPFRVSYPTVLKDLERELAHLGATQVMIEARCDESAIRRDGQLYADARLSGPGIVLTIRTRAGETYRYPCDTYTEWQDNLRAIGLTLERLRAIDRYGVAKHREQYAGWKALPNAGQSSTTMTADHAARLLAQFADIHPQLVLYNAEKARSAIRVARSKTHPDAGGSAQEFALVEEARRVLEQHHGGKL